MGHSELIMESPRDTESIPGLIREAIEEGREWIRSEIALARAQVAKAAGDYASAAIAWVLAAVFVLLGLVYLGFALILFLSPYLGPAAAAAVVAFGMLIAALAAFLYGRAKFLRAKLVPPRLERALGPLDHGRERDLR
jgi:hypothetical protein